MKNYHDTEWGVPVFKDQKLFEFLVLEGAQAGLSWETVLKKRAGYKKAFHNFNVVKIAQMTDGELLSLQKDERIIRNRLKIFSVRTNAKIFIEIQKEFGTFSTYLWQFVDGKQIINHWRSAAEIPTNIPESKALARDLKKRGMTFVGGTIMYAYMQAVGLVDDHLVSCWKKTNLGHRKS